MKKFYGSLAILSLAFLIGCAYSTGTQMDATTLQKIKLGTTTKAELLEWFGSPMTQALDTNGKTALTWYYGKAQTFGDFKKQMLSVVLDTNNIVEKFTLTDDVNK